MERESTKHNPRVDDQMVHESSGLLQGRTFGEGRAEGFSHESPEDDAGAGRRPEVEIPNTPVQPDEIELRADLAACLRPSAFPGSADDLRAVAREEFAPQPVLDLLAILPDGTYQTVAEVWEATGGDVERREGSFGR
jgi:hypothetical protein